jgi:hypothetical protein
MPVLDDKRQYEADQKKEEIEHVAECCGQRDLPRVGGNDFCRSRCSNVASPESEPLSDGGGRTFVHWATGLWAISETSLTPPPQVKKQNLTK